MGTSIVVAHAARYGGNFLFLGGRGGDFVGCTPRAFAEPGVVGALEGAGDGEESLRDAVAEAFVDSVGVKREWHGGGFIGAGVEELAVDENRDRNQVRFALWRNLQQADGARAGRRLFTAGDLGGANFREKQSEDDEADRTAI